MSSKTHIVVHADAIKVRLNFVSYNKEPDHSCGGDNSENLLDVIYVHDNSSRAHLESKELTFGPHATRESTVTGTQSLAPTLRVTAWRGHPASPAAQRAEESVIRTGKLAQSRIPDIIRRYSRSCQEIQFTYLAIPCSTNLDTSEPIRVIQHPDL